MCIRDRYTLFKVCDGILVCLTLRRVVALPAQEIRGGFRTPCAASKCLVETMAWVHCGIMISWFCCRSACLCYLAMRHHCPHDACVSPQSESMDFWSLVYEAERMPVVRMEVASIISAL